MAARACVVKAARPKIAVAIHRQCIYIKHQEFFFKAIHREFMVYRSKICTMHAIPANWPFLGFSESQLFWSYRKAKAFLVWLKKMIQTGVAPPRMTARCAEPTDRSSPCMLYKVVLPGLPERARPPLTNQAPLLSKAATARARCLRSLPPPLPRLGRRERPELPCPFLAFPPAGLRWRPLSPLPPFDSWGGGEGERLRLSRRLPGEGRWVGGPVHKAPKAPAVEWTRSWPIQALRRSGPSAATFAPRHMGSTVCLRHRLVGSGKAGRAPWRKRTVHKNTKARSLAHKQLQSDW